MTGDPTKKSVSTTSQLLCYQHRKGIHGNFPRNFTVKA